jgi:hypothetical protein
METRLHQFIHKNKGKRTISKVPEVITRPSGPFKAVLVAQVLPQDPKLVGIGWAMARTENGKFVDKFDKEVGLRLATDRAATMKEPVPFTLAGDVAAFIIRAKKYFKDRDVLTPEISDTIPKVTHPKTASDKRFKGPNLVNFNRLKKGDHFTVLKFDNTRSDRSFIGYAFEIKSIDLPFIVASCIDKRKSYADKVIFDSRVAELKITSPDFAKVVSED